MNALDDYPNLMAQRIRRWVTEELHKTLDDVETATLAQEMIPADPLSLGWETFQPGPHWLCILQFWGETEPRYLHFKDGQVCDDPHDWYPPQMGEEDHAIL